MTGLEDEVQGRYRLLLDAVTEAPIPLAPVAESAARLMTDYGIASYDAVHAATVIAAGAEAIVLVQYPVQSTVLRLRSAAVDSWRLSGSLLYFFANPVRRMMRNGSACFSQEPSLVSRRRMMQKQY